MSIEPEIVYRVTYTHWNRTLNYIFNKGHRQGKCAYCGKECYKKGYFCTDTFLAILDENKKVVHMSECVYEYFKDSGPELVEWITE